MDNRIQVLSPQQFNNNNLEDNTKKAVTKLLNKEYINELKKNNKLNNHMFYRPTIENKTKIIDRKLTSDEFIQYVKVAKAIPGFTATQFILYKEIKLQDRKKLYKLLHKKVYNSEDTRLFQIITQFLEGVTIADLVNDVRTKVLIKDFQIIDKVLGIL